MVRECQKEATARYVKENERRVVLKFYPPDHDLYDWLQEKYNVSGYIKDLLRKEMKDPR